ncbi:MAG: phosphoribosylglycinamide formyltransferase [Mycobacteriales bacterium]
MPADVARRSGPFADARIVVLVSGAGTLLQALLDASVHPGYPARVVAVGADRSVAGGLDRAHRHDVPTFIRPVAGPQSRADWDAALAADLQAHRPDLIVLAGFMKLVGVAVQERFADRIINSHPALLPVFPGMHAPRDALNHGVTVTGCSLFLVGAGVDDGPIVAQVGVAVEPGDDEETLHERIKVAERALLVDTVDRMCRLGWTVTGRKVSIP